MFSVTDILCARRWKRTLRRSCFSQQTSKWCYELESCTWKSQNSSVHGIIKRIWSKSIWFKIPNANWAWCYEKGRWNNFSFTKYFKLKAALAYFFCCFGKIILKRVYCWIQWDELCWKWIRKSTQKDFL